ncbi:polycystin family receptor for egg jelly-like [Podarcis raffonei]|uniref:polycystin family receptor for egg jelly-like n=1 Tax=Podarcis raffonei TaxID=65483 RepID=UPI0023293DB0|nr:polycystin family receptor for egg jelly-like [Podarcis raffonei]
MLLVFLFCYCSQYATAVPFRFLPPPLLVTCSNPQHRVYQKHDNELHVSCFWDERIDLKYSRAQSLPSEIKEEKLDTVPPPHCQWYQDSILVKNTNRWSGELVLGAALTRGGLHPPWAFIRVTVQCVSVSCHVATCAHKNLTIEISRQDVRLFLLSPRTLPIHEWQPVQLGWCARLKSSTWSYRFKSQGGIPEDLLIPSNLYSEPLAPTVYPHAEMHQACTSYYSYYITVRYHLRGFYTASLHIENGPPLGRSLSFYVQPTLLHVFSTSSTLLSLPHRTLNLSWTLQPLSSKITAYTLVDVQGVEEWSDSYRYNPFALQSDFCAVRKPQNSREKVVASVYFRTNEKMPEQLAGKLDFFNETLIFRASTGAATYLTLNPQKTRRGIYIFSHTLGLYYSTQEDSTPPTTRKGYSSHYIFYEEQSLCYLIIVEFMHLQLSKFSIHVYLNRKGTLFRSLGEKDIEVHIFNGHSPDKSLVYIVWFIPVQHPLLQCEWTFNLQLFNSRKGYLLWNNTYSYSNSVKDAAHFLPPSVLSIRPSQYMGFVAKVNCSKSGLARAVLKASINTFASKVLHPAVACQQSYCHELTAIIHKPDFSDPIIHYKRESAITLQATAKAQCRTSADIDILWKIYSLEAAYSIPDWPNPLKLPDEINTSGIIFHIPRNVLFYGFHHVNMTMTVYLPAYNIKIMESDSVFLQILENDLVAIIAGGLFRTVGVSDHWTLDASASSDPYSANPLEGITFNWYCTKRELDYSTMRLSPEGKCCPNQVDIRWTHSSAPVQKVEPNTFQANTKYYFILVILKQHKSAHAFQTVHVLPGSVPILDATCLENCGKAIKVTERFILSARCLNCAKTSQTVYLWSLLSANSKEIHFDWASKTTTGRSKPYMHINSLAFRYMEDKFYTLSLKVSTKGKQSAVYRHSFYVSSPPQTGKCIIYPREGIAFRTKFIVQCTGFEEKNGPLTYKVIAHSDLTKMTAISSAQNNTFGIIVYIGHQQKTPPSFLPAGIPSKKYALDIYVQVYDAYGVFSEVTLEANVYDPRSKPTVLLRELYGLISGESGPMSFFLETKDYFNIGFLTYMVASVLNNIETLPTNQGSKTDLREILLNVSAVIPLTEIQMIAQTVSSICQVTQDANEVNRKAQLFAVRTLKEATEALKRLRDKDLGSQEAEVLGNGIFTGLSNVLSASLLNHRNVNVNAIKEIISVTGILADLILQGKVPGEHETNMKAKNWSIHLWKGEKWEVSRTISKGRQCKNYFYPQLKQENHIELPADAVVSTVHYVFEENPFPWMAGAADIHTVVTGFKMVGVKANGDILGVTPEVVEVIMARKNKDFATFNLTIGPDKKLSKTTGGFSIEVKGNFKYVFIQILCNMKVTFNISIYLGLNVSHSPIASYIVFHDKPPAPREMNPGITNCAFKAVRILCLPQSLLQSPLQGNKASKWNISVVLQSHPIVRGQTRKIVRIAVYTPSCLGMDGIQKQWKEGLCRLGSQTTWSKIHCICEAKAHSTTRSRRRSQEAFHAVRFVAGSFILYPNPLDINKVLSADFDTNPVTMLAVFFIFSGYILCTTWAMIKDKADLKRKNKILVLPDNDPYHKVRYVVTVYTGSRLGSGTTADVFLELIGKNGVSDVHHLKHPQFPTLFRAAVDTFLLTTKYDLGDLLSLHVWHNTGGSSPNWFLSRIKVQNMHTKKSWLFICRNWLGLGKADGKIERSVVAKNLKSSLDKMDYFWISFAKDLEDNHIWLSIFSQVVTGSFTRVQRVSCCLVIMLCNLLFNIMFFSGADDREILSVQLRYLKSMYIGFVSALFSIPLQLTIQILFTYSEEKPLLHNTRNGSKRSPSLMAETLEKEGKSAYSNGKDQHLPLSESNASNNNATDKDTGTTFETEEPLHPEFMFFNKKPRFSWWCRYVSWTLVFLISGVSSSFIILYGLTYGYTTSMEWFIASMTSFFESVFLLQTMKLSLISAMSTISLKYCKNIPWISTEQYQNMKLIQSSVDEKDLRKIHHDLSKLRHSKEYEPLTEDEVIVLRKRVRAQHLAFVFVKDIVIHLVYSSCVFIAAFSAEPTTTFYYNKAIYNKFSFGLSDVNKLEHIYMWTSNVFLPLIHNDHHPTYVSESWSKILGLPRMRQVRAKNTEKECFPAHNFAQGHMISESHCRYKYHSDPEDQSNYLGSWTIPTNQPTSKHSSSFQGFTYQSDIDQWEYKSYGVVDSYGPGGYSFYFFPGEQRPNTTMRMDDLQRNNWLDNRTWAVIFELTTFNPDVDLFCSISIVFETTDVGVVNSSLVVHSYKLSIFQYEPTSKRVVYGVIVYILAFYLADEFNMLRQERIGYLQTATNVNNFAIKTTSMFFLLLIALKFKLAFTLLEFHLLNPEQFVPFHVVSQIDQLYMMISGFLVFLLILKPYRYFRFLYNVRLAEKTMSVAFPEFVNLTLFAAVYFSVFTSFGYLSFGQSEWSFHTWILSLQTVVSYCFGAVKLASFSSNLWLGIFFQASCMFTMMFIFINLWRALIISTYNSMKQPTYEQHSDEAEAINFVVLKIQSIWYSITRQTPPTSDSDHVSTVIFGRSVVKDDYVCGLRSRQVNGKKIVYLSV